MSVWDKNVGYNGKTQIDANCFLRKDLGVHNIVCRSTKENLENSWGSRRRKKFVVRGFSKGLEYFG